jgi:hypothetical protein
MISTRLISSSLGDVLMPLIPDRMAALDAVVVSEIDAPGRIAYISPRTPSTIFRTRKDLECKTAGDVTSMRFSFAFSGHFERYRDVSPINVHGPRQAGRSLLSAIHTSVRL